MKIVEYKLISGDTSSYLNEAVGCELHRGFQPTGGIFFNQDGTLHQAMVKYEETEPFLAGMSCPPIKMKIKDDDEPVPLSEWETMVIENENLKEEIRKQQKKYNCFKSNCESLEQEYWKLREENEKLKEENEAMKYQATKHQKELAEENYLNQNKVINLLHIAQACSYCKPKVGHIGAPKPPLGCSNDLHEENERLKKENLLLIETSKPRDNFLLSSLDTIELLSHALKYFIVRNSRYSLRHGYEITICGDDYCDDDHEKYHESILNNYLEKNRK